MFRKEGGGRSHRLNQLLAGYLAFVGGYVNATGIMVLGAFTSHMTGNVSRAATELASGGLASASSTLAIIIAFFLGALLASTILESDFFGTTSRAYGVALSAEIGWLVLFGVLPLVAPHGRRATGEVLCLSLAMGMQNSLVTRLSGAVVRTTHLTGVITDLGIETARWLRWWRGTASRRIGVKLAFGRNPAERPARAKIELLATIAGAFGLGALAGGVTALVHARGAIIFPVVALGAGAFYAFLSHPLEAPGSIPPDSRA